MKKSAVIATYNGEKFIEEQLQSIYNQTLEIDEVIISDDSSKDKTVSVVRSFIEERHLQGKWTLIINSENLGYAENFRRAMDACTGELMFLCDQDDIWAIDRVEKMTFIMQEQTDIGLLTSAFQEFRDGEKPELKTEIDYQVEKIPLNRHTRYLRSLGCVMCVRVSFYHQIKRFWYQGWAHDEFLWSLAMIYECGYSTQYISMYRRIHATQVSGKLGHSIEKRIEYLKDVEKSSRFLLNTCTELGKPKYMQRLYKKSAITHRYRLELVQDSRLSRAFLLLPYLGFYYAPKSYLVELAMALGLKEGEGAR